MTRPNYLPLPRSTSFMSTRRHTGHQHPTARRQNSSIQIIYVHCRQKMAEILIHDLHNLASEALKTMTSSRSYQIMAERQISEKATLRVGNGRSSPVLDSDSASPMTSTPYFGLTPSLPWSSSSSLHSQISRPPTLTSKWTELYGLKLETSFAKNAKPASLKDLL